MSVQDIPLEHYSVSEKLFLMERLWTELIDSLAFYAGIAVVIATVSTTGVLLQASDVFCWGDTESLLEGGLK